MMPDPRFFDDLGPVSLADLASLTGAELSDLNQAARLVRGVSILSKARADHVSFLTDRRHGAELAASGAGACFVTPRDADLVPAGCVALTTRTPQAAYAIAADRLHRARILESGPAVSPGAVLEDGVTLAPGVVIGDRARIGAGTVIGANTVIGPGVAIGRDCRIGSNVTIGFALIGDRVRLYAGVVIGEAGFGATGGAAGVIDVPQLGRVIIQDGVTIGANTCVDRGAFDDTSIGENTKIDNLIQIAHNVRIGRNCVMASHTGISGSVVIGDGAALGGRVGIADHLNIGAGAQLGANAGLLRDVPAGETWAGFPAQPVRQWLREVASIRRLAGKTKDGGGK
jgi:UDP-3-O-[3-hydroxymyristoyl] glucosamine N-acyltransferase